VAFLANVGRRRAFVSHSKEAAQAEMKVWRQAGSLSYEPNESPPVMAWPLRGCGVRRYGGVIGISGIF